MEAWAVLLVLIQLAAGGTTSGRYEVLDRVVAYQAQEASAGDAVVSCWWWPEHGATFAFQIRNASDATLALNPDKVKVRAVLLAPDGREEPDRLRRSVSLRFDPQDAPPQALQVRRTSEPRGSWNEVKRTAGGPKIEPTRPDAAGASYRVVSRGGRGDLESLRFERQTIAPGETSGGVLQWDLPKAPLRVLEVTVAVGSGTASFRFEPPPAAPPPE